MKLLAKIKDLKYRWDDAGCNWRGFIWWIWHDSRISTVWFNLKYGLQNLWRWRRIIWEDRDWDHMYLLAVMKKKIEQMEITERKFSLHASAPRHAQQLRVCRLLINRIERDDYCLYPDDWNRMGNKRAWQHEEYLMQQDYDLLFKIMPKYIREWWS